MCLRKKNQTTSNWVRKASVIIISVLIILTISVIEKRAEEEFQEENALINVQEKIGEIEAKTKPEDSKERLEISKKGIGKETLIDDLKKENPDIIGALFLPSGQGKYPILLSESGEYLRKNHKKEESILGSIFIDQEEFASGSRTKILYGHNMKSGKMFGFLKNFLEEKYAKENREISVCWENKYKKYELCGVMRAKSEDETLQKELLFPDKQANNDLKQRIRKEGKEYAEFTENDHLLILATCEYSQKNGRLLVIYKEIQ